MNLESENLAGFSSGSFSPHQTIWEFLPSFQEYKYKQLLKKHIQESRPCTIETYAPEFSAWLRWVFYPTINGIGALVTDITREVNNQTGLLEQELKINSLLENTTESILFLNTDCEIINFNKTAYNKIVSNNGKELLIGASFKDYIYEGGEEDFYRAYHSALNGEPFTLEKKLNFSDADYWFYSTHTPVRDLNGKIVGVNVISGDITGRRKAELAVDESTSKLSYLELKLKSILDSTQEFVLLVSTDFRILCFNKRVELNLKNHKGQSVQEGSDFRDFMSDAMKPVIIKSIEETKKGKHVSIEGHGINSLNNFWYEHRFSPTYDMDGKLMGVTIISVDITEKKQFNEKLKISEAKYRDLFINTPTCNIIWDPATLKVLEVNKAVIEKYGYTREEWSNMTILDFRPKDEHDRILETVNNIKPSIGFQQQGHWKHCKKDGEIMLMEITTHEIIYNNKIAIFSTANDVTELKVALEQVSKSKQRFLRVLQKSPLAKCLTLKSDEVVLYNDQFVKLFGYTKKDVPNMETWWKLACPNPLYLEEVKNQWHERIKKAKELNCDFEPLNAKVRCKDGTIKDIEFNYADLGEEYLVVFNDVTEKIKAEEQIRLSAERFKSIISVSNTGAWEYHADSGYLWCSKEYFSMLGRNSEDYSFTENQNNLNAVWVDLLHPEDRESASSHFIEYLKNGSTGTYESYFRMLHSNGEWVWIWSRGQTLRDVNGVLTTLTVGTHIDITERKKAEQALLDNNLKLQESEFKLQSILDNTSDSIVLMDMNYKVLCCNAAIKETLKHYFSKELKEGDDYRDFVVPENRQLFLDAFDLAKNGESLVVENETKSENVSFWFEYRVTPVYFKDGSLMGVTLTATNITERKNAEIALRKSEEKFRKIIEFSPLPMLIISESLVITFSNPAAQELFGYTIDELNNQSLQQLSAHDSNEDSELPGIHDKPIKQVITGEVIELIKKNGQHFFAEAKFGAFESESEGFTVLTLHDVSERIQFELKITKYNHELSLLNRVNDVILQSQSEFELFDSVCETIIADDAYCLAWIAHPPSANDHSGTIQPLSKAGIVSYLDGLNISVKDSLTKNGPTATALTKGLTVVTNNTSQAAYFQPWAERVKKYGIGSSVALALQYQDQILGVLNIYSPSPDAFDSMEVNILERVAGNVALAVNNIRNKNEKIETAYKLHQRVIEIQTIYEINNLIRDEEADFTSVLSKAVQLISNGMQFTDICDALICFDDVCYQSDSYSPTEYNMVASKKADDGKLLVLEVVYNNETPQEFEGPFFKEERELIDTVVEILITFYNKNIIRQKLKASESNLKSVFENTDVGHLLLDKDYTIVSFNNSLKKGYATISGMEIEMNKKLTDLILDHRKEAFRKILETVNERKKPYSYDMAYQYNKRTYHFSMNIVPVLEGKEITGYSISAYDITERKQLEVERQKIINDMLQRNRDLEQFSYIVSHNIRSPLATLLGFSKLLKSDLNDREKEFVFKGMEESAQKLDNTIKDVNEILNVKKEISQSKVKINLNEIIQGVLGSIEGMLKSSGAKVYYDFSEVKEIKSVRPYIQSVFVNLISNAIKYARKGVIAEIHIDSVKHGNQVHITFRDNGTGIDMENYGDQLFGLYKKFNMDVEGKGMGLFMVKTQINAIGGEIEVDSKLGSGTTFTVKLPL